MPEECPSLIILFTWTGAHPRHISNYVASYTTLFPSSAIMVITTSLNDLIYRTTKTKHDTLAPAISTILSEGLSTSVLVHAFSEGGAHKAVHFARAFQSQSDGQKLPILGLLLDSCPGNLHFTKMASVWRRATATSSLATRIAGSVAAYAVVTSYIATYFLIGDVFIEDSKKLFTKTGRSINNPALWDTNVPRCYLLSRRDKLSPCKNIIKHANEAKILGNPGVHITQFDNSAQCDHLAEDAWKYWSAVGELWDTAVLYSQTVADEKSNMFDLSVTVREVTPTMEKSQLPSRSSHMKPDFALSWKTLTVQKPKGYEKI